MGPIHIWMALYNPRGTSLVSSYPTQQIPLRNNGAIMELVFPSFIVLVSSYPTQQIPLYNNGAIMELVFPSFIVLVSISILLFHFTVRARSRGCKLPPSPWKLPIIGHIHHLMLGGAAACPHHILRDLARKYGPIMLLKLGEVDHVIVSSPEIAKEIMKTHDLNFASRPQILFSTIMLDGGKDILFSPYGSYWRQLRKICALELMSPKRVKAFRPTREEAMASFVRDIAMSSGSPFNLSRELLALNSTIISRAAFGKETRHAQRFMSIVREVLDLIAGFTLADFFPSLTFMATLTGVRGKLERAHQELDGVLNEIIKEHQEKNHRNSSEGGDEDLVDVLLRLKDDAGLEVPLTMTGVKAVILDVYVAGSETTQVVVEWAISELMRHPDAMKKAQAEVRRAVGGKGVVVEGDFEEMPYMKQIVKESLRLYTPGPLLIPRVGAETREVGGFSIAAGSRVLVNVWAMARDPRYWEDPESFRPERFDGSPVDFRGGSLEFLPFGGGRRTCPGIDFGLASIDSALAHLLFHFDWELPDGMKPEELDMTESFRTSIGRKSDLILLANLRVPLPTAVI